MNRPILLLCFILCAAVAFPQQVRLAKLLPALNKHTAQDAERLRLLTATAKAYTVVRMDTAILFATQAITLAERLGDQSTKAYATAVRGTAEAFRGDRLLSLSDLRSALKTAERLGHLPSQLQAHYGLMCLANIQGRDPDADKEFNSAMALAETLHDTLSMMQVLSQQGAGLYNRGLYDRSLKLLDEAIEFGRRSTIREGRPLAFANRVFTRASLGDLEGSATDLDSAFATANVVRDRLAMVMTFMNQGSLQYIRSNYPKALEGFLTALHWTEQTDDRVDRAALLCNIGKLYAAMNDETNAMVYAVQAVGLARNSGAYTALLYSLEDIANLGGNLNARNICIPAYKELGRLADSLKNNAFMVYADLGLADSYMKFNMDDSAVFYSLRSVRGARELGAPYTIGYALLGQGRVLSYASDGALIHAGIDPKERSAIAIKALNEAMPTNTDNVMAYDCYSALSRIHERDGNFAEALRCFRTATAIHDSVITQDRNQAIGDLQIQYDTEKKEQQIVLLGKDKEVQVKEIQKQKLMRNGFMGGFALVGLFAAVFFFQRNRISKEKKRSETLLLNILPQEVAEELKAKGEADAKLIDLVTVLFTDFKGFTAMSELLSPKELVRDIHECFSAFDHIMEKHGIEKIKTIGDAYMAAGGLPTANGTHALDVVKAALEIRDFIAAGKAHKLAHGDPYFEIRIGVHTGPVVAGIVGVKKFAYDIWGDTVNTASRMESSGSVGEVNISGSTYSLVKDEPGFTFTPRGKVLAKGKGEMDMYFVEGPASGLG